MALLLLVVLATLLVGAVATSSSYLVCPAPPALQALYNPSDAMQCPSAAACVKARCDCLGDAYELVDSKCVATGGALVTSCSIVSGCQSAYVRCLENAATSFSGEDGVACALWATSLRSQLADLSEDPVELLRSACLEDTCQFLNQTDTEQLCVEENLLEQTVCPNVTKAPTTSGAPDGIDPSSAPPSNGPTPTNGNVTDDGSDNNNGAGRHSVACACTFIAVVLLAVVC